MTQVTVFVDDAVQGHLPSVCAKTGVPSDGLLRIEQQVGDGARLGVLWLLVFVGPFGWLVLLALSVTRSGRGEVLSVQLPFSEAAVDRFAVAAQQLRRCVIVAVGGVVLFVASLSLAGGAGQSPLIGLTAVAGALVVGAIVAAVAIDLRRSREAIGVHLDASRRWVTLSKVHPGPSGHIRGSDRSGVTLYIQVRDLRVSLDRAVELGGQIVMEPLDLPGGPTLAAITDPEGNPVTLVQQ